MGTALTTVSSPSAACWCGPWAAFGSNATRSPSAAREGSARSWQLIPGLDSGRGTSQHVPSLTFLHVRVQEDGSPVLNNHLRYTVLYHEDPVEGRARVNDLRVEAFSVKHSYEGSWEAEGAPFLSQMPLPSPRIIHSCYSLHATCCPWRQGRLMLLLHTVARAELARWLSRMRTNTGKKATLTTCDPSSKRITTENAAPQLVEEGQEVIYTYDVRFLVRSATVWASP